MISLEQIRTLETRVHGAVERIKSLTAENGALTDKLSNYERRIDELQAMVSEFKTGQEEIERGIMSALTQLDGLEDQVSSETPDSSAAPEVTSMSLNSDTGHATGEVEDSSADSDPAESAAVSNEESAPSDSADDESGADEPADSHTTVELIESDEEEPELDIF